MCVCVEGKMEGLANVCVWGGGGNGGVSKCVCVCVGGGEWRG